MNQEGRALPLVHEVAVDKPAPAAREIVPRRQGGEEGNIPRRGGTAHEEVLSAGARPDRQIFPRLAREIPVSISRQDADRAEGIKRFQSLYLA